MKKDISPVAHFNELGPQQDFVNYNKPALHNAPTDKQTKANLDKLLDNNKDAFADDERQIGTIPLIEMTTDTGDHLPTAEKPYTLALKHYDWVKRRLTNCLKQESLGRAIQAVSSHCSCAQGWWWEDFV